MRSNDDALVKAVVPRLPILAALVITSLVSSACSNAAAPSPVLTATQTVAPSSTPGSENQKSSVNNLTRGAKLYAANCQVCHGGSTGGGMLDIPPPNNARGHTWHHADCQLIGIVLNGSDDTVRGMLADPDAVPRMPAWKGVLTEEEVVAILGHIKTWWTEEQREFQDSVTREHC
jgi:mono/diheme cytochrome c family protein